MLYIPDLKGQFFCYVQPNLHGFLGELRDMVRLDMTVGEAIAFHVKNWNFEESMNARKLHEFAHQPFAIGTIYIPELAKYRIQADAQTSLLKPQGYNGFMEGELIAIAIQNVIEGILEGEQTNNWASDLREGVKRAVYHYGSILRNNDLYFWLEASYSEQRQSLFEVKFEKQFMLEPPSVPLLGPNFRKPNRHGEFLREYKEPSDTEIEAIATRMSKFFEFVDYSFKDNDIKKTYQAAQFLYGVKIRDLHSLIGGEDAANEYFRKCGVVLNRTHKKPELGA